MQWFHIVHNNDSQGGIGSSLHHKNVLTYLVTVKAFDLDISQSLRRVNSAAL